MGFLELAKEEKRRREAGEPPLPALPPPPSFAQKTGQFRRLLAAQSVVSGGGLVIFGGWWRMDGPYGPILTILGTLVAAIGFAAMCVAVRCPRCRVPVVWHTFKTRKASEAPDAAVYQAACPRCGYDAG